MFSWLYRKFFESGKHVTLILLKNLAQVTIQLIVDYKASLRVTETRTVLWWTEP